MSMDEVPVVFMLILCLCARTACVAVNMHAHVQLSMLRFKLA